MLDRLIKGWRNYAWLIVLVTFVTLITTAGFRATPGVLIVPLQNEFGWSRGTISVAIAIGLVLFGLTAPFSAALMEPRSTGSCSASSRARSGFFARRSSSADSRPPVSSGRA